HRRARGMRNDHLRAALAQQLAQNRSVTAVRGFAVAADRKVRLLAERREQLDGPLRLGALHLPQIPLPVRGPSRVGPRLRLRVGNQLARRRHRGRPDVEQVALRIFLCADASRQQPDRAEANALAARAWVPNPYNANHVWLSTAVMISSVTSSGRRAPSMRQYVGRLP